MRTPHIYHLSPSTEPEPKYYRQRERFLEKEFARIAAMNAAEKIDLEPEREVSP